MSPRVGIPKKSKAYKKLGQSARRAAVSKSRLYSPPYQTLTKNQKANQTTPKVNVKNVRMPKDLKRKFKNFMVPS